MSLRQIIYLLTSLLIIGIWPIAAMADASADKTGGWRLHNQSSPYLRMHEDNPVNWYPWGEAALTAAKEENKPLFISIGYFTCHWCHVMEKESFRNPDIAKLLNENFISIKIDREQRPDLDAAFMRFVVATQHRGGWPMSVWATSEGKPIFGGTYFPPESRGGQTGLTDVLNQIATLWKQDPDKVNRVGNNMVKRLIELYRQPEAPSDPLTQSSISEALQAFNDDFDELNGGFSVAPKFPQPLELLFLLSSNDKTYQNMVFRTLEHMRRGGIHDQVGGGFHRYAVDAQWHVPHFEKMLYDQALIARAYTSAWSYSHIDSFSRTTKDTINFVLNAMRHTEGGFYSALSADSATSRQSPDTHMEGAFYVWDEQQLTQALTDKMQHQWAIERFGIKADGNVGYDPSGELDGYNVLHLVKTNTELAKQFGITEAHAQTLSWRVQKSLLKARNTRPAVPMDDKIISEWNGYMITTLVVAATVLDEPSYQEAAIKAANFIKNKLYHSSDGILYRDWRNGQHGVAGFAEDYAAMIEASLALYNTTTDKTWLDWAHQLMQKQLELFWDEEHGGFYSTEADSGFWLRRKEATDGVTPSANSVSIGNLVQLGELMTIPDYLKKSTQVAQWSLNMLRDTPESMSYALLSWPSLLTLTAETKQTTK